MSNGIALVTELRYPTINSDNAKDIIRFKVQYSSYLHQLAELNNSRADNDKLILTGIHHCFEPRVLEALIGMGVFDAFVENEGGNERTLNSVDELTLEISELWIDYMAESLEADIPSRVEEALSTICFGTIEWTHAGLHVRVPTYTCNDTCIALSGRVQRHL
jgi:hypothetical protein